MTNGMLEPTVLSSTVSTWSLSPTARADTWEEDSVNRCECLKVTLGDGTHHLALGIERSSCLAPSDGSATSRTACCATTMDQYPSKIQVTLTRTP